MNQAALVAVAVAVIGVVLVVVAGAGGLGVSSEVSGGAARAIPVDALPEPPADGSYGIVFGTHRAKSGLSVFGWRITQPEFHASVGFVPPAGCAIPESGTVEPTGPCAGIPAWGMVSGGGTTSEGHDFVIVSVPVSEACHKALSDWDRWPSDLPVCAD